MKGNKLISWILLLIDNLWHEKFLLNGVMEKSNAKHISLLFYLSAVSIFLTGNCCVWNSKNCVNMKSSLLENKLVEIGYPSLFMHGSRSLADSIWEGGKNKTDLQRITQNSKSSLLSKFLAAEMLRHFNIDLDSDSYGAVAKAYTYVLKETSADRGNSVHLNGNLWGLLYEENDAGHLGSQFIKFGEASIPSLTKLLNDNSSRILYEGSQEAMIGNAYQYRIKDFAAFYISKIKNIPIKFYQDFEERDKEIERLKKLLESDKK